MDSLFALASANLGPPAHLNPVVQREIDALGAVEAHIEPGVIPSWKGDHKLALLLYHDIWSATLSTQIVRRDGKRLVSQELITLASVRGKVA